MATIKVLERYNTPKLIAYSAKTGVEGQAIFVY